MYKSPIEIINDEIKMHFENEILKAIQHYEIQVDKDELIKALNYDRNQYEKGYNDAVDNLQKTGKWVGIEYDGYADGNPVYDVWECSNCHEEHEGDFDSLPNYCPECGAKMTEDKT